MEQSTSSSCAHSRQAHDQRAPHSSCPTSCDKRRGPNRLSISRHNPAGHPVHAILNVGILRRYGWGFGSLVMFRLADAIIEEVENLRLHQAWLHLLPEPILATFFGGRRQEPHGFRRRLDGLDEVRDELVAHLQALACLVVVRHLHLDHAAEAHIARQIAVAHALGVDHIVRGDVFHRIREHRGAFLNPLATLHPSGVVALARFGRVFGVQQRPRCDAVILQVQRELDGVACDDGAWDTEGVEYPESIIVGWQCKCFGSCQ
mmetsp:Transcript_14127/g.38907  ORF Transcript_14127/g.38907 Transcript_14127/m.38907 type:complete len:261 (+) Transcript_14127:76-858(+)